MITLQVFGRPKAQPRVKAARRGSFVHMYTPKSADDWKQTIVDCVAEQRARGGCVALPLKGPLSLEVTFYMPSAAHSTDIASDRHAKKPDIDNLLKAVMDALTWAGMWGDDSQVWKVAAAKLYVNKRREAGAEIVVTRWGGGV